LTPLLAVVIGIYMTIFKHFGFGPVWPTVLDGFVNSCTGSWYFTLLYVHNIFPGEMCVEHAWYSSADFQLILVSPILLLSLNRWPKMTLIMIGILAVCSTITGFLTSWLLEITISSLDIEKNRNLNRYFYYATWLRCSPWLIGLIVGYVIFEVKRKQFEFTINKIIASALCAASLAVMYVCVFEGYDVIIGKSDKVTDAFRIALVRPSWVIAVSWIIFACAVGYGGPINKFLSLPVFQILSKLTYSMYLIHFPIMVVVIGKMATPSVFTTSQMFYGFWSDFMVILMVSTVLSLAFELPVVAIEKYFSSRSPRKIKKI
ncbi:hypothetical protein ILUMI_14495, partial [Ignelater luminosus]